VVVVWVLAVDFGTSNTAAAVSRDGAPGLVLQLTSQASTMPSAVLWTGEEFKVGLAAEHSALVYASGFEGAPKSRLGKGTKLLGGESVEPAVLAAQVLGAVRKKAWDFNQQEPPSQVWLTYPAKWTQTQTDDLEKAAELAGFDPQTVALVAEPVAAAQHYAASASTSLEPGGRIMVVDVGGGTCDVAVVQKTTDGGFLVVDHDGDPELGGNLFDLRLRTWTTEQLRQQGRTDMVEAFEQEEHLGELLTLQRTVRYAKEDLTSHASADIHAAVAGHQARISITKTEYNELIAPEVSRVGKLITEVLDRVGDPKPDIVYATGGASLTPAVADMIVDTTGQEPALRDNPKTVVAQGALTPPTTEIEPEDTKPEDTKLEDTKPEDTKPEDTKPEDTKPEDTKPDRPIQQVPLAPRRNTTKVVGASIAGLLVLILMIAFARIVADDGGGTDGDGITDGGGGTTTTDPPPEEPQEDLVLAGDGVEQAILDDFATDNPESAPIYSVDCPSELVEGDWCTFELDDGGTGTVTVTDLADANDGDIYWEPEYSFD
jgi:actin-like ATPase involved in cell morphogenesis